MGPAVETHCMVAVIAVEQGRLALCSGPDGLRLPAHEGSGEEACRHVMRSSLGSAEGQVRLLGTVAAAGPQPALEVWLARRVPHRLTSAESAEVQWLARDEVVALVGSTGLRDTTTLVALTVAGLSDLLLESGSYVTADRPRSKPAPTPVEAAAGGGRSVTGLFRAFRPGEALETAPTVTEGLLNEDLSDLEFNARVLALAEDSRTPLLARVRFLSIFSANLDEFFRGRVGELKHAVAAGTVKLSPDGLGPQQELEAIAARVRTLLERAYRCFRDLCVGQLPAHGIRIRRWADLEHGEQAYLRVYFKEQVFPVLTPKAITLAPGHPFPQIVDLRISLAVVTHDPRTDRLHVAHLKIPDSLPRFVRLATGHDFVPLEDIIAANVEALFSGRRVKEVHPFRITRAGEMHLDEQGSADLLQAMEEELKHRPFGAAVRIEVERSMPQAIRDLLLQELRFEEVDQVSSLTPEDVYEMDGMVDLGALQEIAAVPKPELHYAKFTGGSPIPAERSIFDILDERDVLVHLPYDSFDATVQRLIVEAADDPDVIAIKLTLYRAGGQSAIVEALLRAAAAGKDVFVFVELKARLDEVHNIYWAKRLKRGGIHVVTGLVRLKTHAKITLVVRRKDGKVRRYVHVGTGNYNAETARLYTDLGLLSSDEALGDDLNVLFNELTASSRPPEAKSQRILVAPTHLRTLFQELVSREVEHAKAGRLGYIRIKINGLADTEMIGALYRASQAGVQIDLIIRGICSLRPGVPGLSERIRVISAVGRFLEHARIFHFAHGGKPEYYIGSADWRPRNLRRRVEVVTSVLDPAACQRLDRILTLELSDPFAWELNSDGSYSQRQASAGADVRSAQERLIELAGQAQR